MRCFPSPPDENGSEHCSSPRDTAPQRAPVHDAATLTKTSICCVHILFPIFDSGLLIQLAFYVYISAVKPLLKGHLLPCCWLFKEPHNRNLVKIWILLATCRVFKLMEHLMKCTCSHILPFTTLLPFGWITSMLIWG